MKKLIFLIASFILPFVFLQAKKVDFQRAVNVAENAAIAENPARSKGIPTTHESRLKLIRQASLEKNYYVFNETDGSGFVIVAGDDVAKPILGYSENGSFDENNLPPAFAYWLDFLNSQIDYAIQNDLPANPEWNKPQKANGTIIVEPLLKTAWAQRGPYNAFCPPNTPTGCTATAMAQIMKYYEHPKRGSGQSEAYISKMPNSNDSYDIPSVDYSQTEYDWENILNTYNGQESEQENNAVATLMYHCGTSIKAMYSTDKGTGAYCSNVVIALGTYFDYDKSILYKQRTSYSDTEWDNLLREQLNAGQPILYGGYNSESGHAFVCDGYSDDGYFHFNWGTGGIGDGYFLSSALNPFGTGTGAGTYNWNQDAVINIFPNENRPLLPNITLSYLMPSQKEMNTEEPFRISFEAFNNNYFVDFSGYVAFGLMDDDNNILEIIGEQSVYIQARTYTYIYEPLFAISSTIPSGTYRIRALLKSVDENEWSILQDRVGREVFITVNNISHETFSPNITLEHLFPCVINNEVNTEEPFYISLGRFMNDYYYLDFSGYMAIALVDNDDNILEIIGEHSQSVYIKGGSFTQITNIMIGVISSAIPTGDYRIRAVVKSIDEENWKIVHETGQEVSVITVHNTGKIPVAFYNLMGIQLPKEPENGVYIILYDNGTAEKRVK